MKVQELNQNTKEIKRWEFRQFHQAHMNSDGQYWDFDILFYGEKIGEALSAMSESTKKRVQ